MSIANIGGVPVHAKPLVSAGVLVARISEAAGYAVQMLEIFGADGYSVEDIEINDRDDDHVLFRVFGTGEDADGDDVSDSVIVGIRLGDR